MAKKSISEKSSQTIIRAHKIRLYPTPEQEQYFVRACGVARFSWNWALERYKKIKEAGEKADWNTIKKEFRAKIDISFPFVREVTKCSPEQAIADLRQSISTYYKTKKGNPKSKVRFPGFRSRARSIGSFGLANDKFYIKEQHAYIPKLGLVAMAEGLRFAGKIKFGRVKEDHGKWFLVVTVEMERTILSRPHNSIGIDFGLSTFAVLSSAEECETQAYFRRSERKLRSLQRSLSRKKKGSKNREKAKVKISRLHQRISAQRADHSHKFSHRVTGDFSVVCVEDLNLHGLIRTRGKSFSDAGIGETVRQLGYKADGSGGILQKVGRFFPSTKRCSECGMVNHNLTLKDRAWVCPTCTAFHNRDFNASVNIELEGIRLLVGCGYLDVTTVELTASAQRVKHLFL